MSRFRMRKLRLDSFAISGLTLVLVIFTALINGLDIYSGEGLVTFRLQEAFSGRWADLLLFPFRIAPGWLSLAFSLYLFWLFGTQLENDRGGGWYTLYIFLGLIAILLGTLFYPLSARYLYFSVFLAAAWRAPNVELLLFFILPVKLKWLAWLSLLFLLYQPLLYVVIYGDFLVLLGPLFGLANFLLFHAAEIYSAVKRRFK